MEESVQQADNEQPPYWKSVAIAGLVFGILVFAISLLTSYITINSEPTGALFTPAQLLGGLGCLFGAFGGMLAIWHYTNKYNVSITLGRGALIGFLTGAAIIVINVFLDQLWSEIDPDMMQQVIESTVANIEAMEMPEAQKQQMIDMTVNSLRERQGIGSQLFWGIPLYGILNLITGMLGVKVFGNKEI